MSKKDLKQNPFILLLLLPALILGCVSEETRDDANERMMDKVVEIEPITLMAKEIDFKQGVAVNFEEYGLLVSLNSIDACGGDYSYTLPDLVSDHTGCVQPGETFCSHKFVKYQVCFTALEFSESKRIVKTRVTLRQTKE